MDEELVNEILARWSKYITMERRISYLVSLPPKETAPKSFSYLVPVLRFATSRILFQEREKRIINQGLLSKVLDTYYNTITYKMEISREKATRWLLEDANTYYSNKASTSIMVDSYEDYMLKVKECKDYENQVDYEPFHIKKEILEIVDKNMLVALASMLEVLKKFEKDEFFLKCLLQSHRRHRSSVRFGVGFGYELQIST